MTNKTYAIGLVGGYLLAHGVESETLELVDGLAAHFGDGDAPEVEAAEPETEEEDEEIAPEPQYKRGRWSAADKESAQEMFDNGANFEEIGTRLNRSPANVEATLFPAADKREKKTNYTYDKDVKPADPDAEAAAFGNSHF